MATNYPGALDNTTVLKNDAVNATLTETTHPAHHNNLSDAVIAIETELGINPSGAGFATVAAAIAALDAGTGAVVVKAPSADQIILPTADKINLALRAFNSGQTSKVLEIRNAAGTVVSYIDKVGALSAASLAIGGTPLAASHLSNGVGGSGVIVLATGATLTTPTITNPTVTTGTFASPTLTGAPVSTTPAGGDDSTRIATTAFVQTALGGANNIPTGAMLDYAGSTAPTGFLMCDGTAVSRTTYAALFAIISTNYGVGDGSTTFNVPDRRGRTSVGLGTHADVDGLGKSDGELVANRRPKHKHTLTHSTDGAHTHTATTSSTGSHTHSGSTSSAGDHTHTYQKADSVGDLGISGAGQNVVTGWSQSNTSTSGGHNHTMSLNTDGVHTHAVTVNSGGSHTHTVTVGPQTTVPTDAGGWLVTNVIIKT